MARLFLIWRNQEGRKWLTTDFLIFAACAQAAGFGTVQRD